MGNNNGVIIHLTTAPKRVASDEAKPVSTLRAKP